MNSKLFNFSGGLVLDNHKLLENIHTIPLPKKLIYPLLQRSEYYLSPTVKVDEQVLKGQQIAESHDTQSAPLHAASSGIIQAIEPHTIAHPSGLKDSCIIIKTDGLNQTQAPLTPLDYQKTVGSLLVNRIQQAGIVGLGGAAFPSAKKLTPTHSIHTLIINGAECEPYISCDALLMQHHAHEVIQGALIMQTILHVKHCIIALETPMKKAFHALHIATKNCPNIKIITIPVIYPTGAEKQLIKVVTGLNIPDGTRPTEHGILCHNIATSYAIYQAVNLGLPLTERIITVTGSGINTPHNLRVPIGTPIHDLIHYCDGYNTEAEHLIMGGPMMGFSLPHDDIGIIKASNCFLVLNHQDTVLNTPPQPCIRCGECELVCPEHLLPQQLHWYSQTKNHQQCENHQLFSCIECGCCDLVCPSQIPLVQQFRSTKAHITFQQQQSTQSAHAKQRYELQKIRHLKVEQEKVAKAAQRQTVIDKMKAAATKRKDILKNQTVN